MEIIPEHLDKLSGIAQCLDDQWAPPEIVAQAARDGRSIASFSDKISEAARREFFKTGVTERSR